MLCNVISYNKSGSNRYHINLLALSLLASVVPSSLVSFTPLTIHRVARSEEVSRVNEPSATLRGGEE